MLVPAPVLLLALTRVLLQVQRLMLAPPPTQAPALALLLMLMRGLLLKGIQLLTLVPPRMLAPALRLVREKPLRPVPRGR